MNIRAYKSSDYATLSQWWEAYNWTPPPEDSLPSSGIVVEGVCAGFLYITNSKMGIMEWIVGNPDASKEARAEAIEKTITAIQGMARGFGIKYLFSSIKHPNLIEHYERAGFVKTDTDMINFIGRLD